MNDKTPTAEEMLEGCELGGAPRLRAGILALQARLAAAESFKEEWHNPSDLLRINELESELRGARMAIAAICKDNGGEFYVRGAALASLSPRDEIERVENVEGSFWYRLVERHEPKTSELVQKLRSGIPMQSCDRPGVFIQCGRGDCACEADLMDLAADEIERLREGIK